MDTSASDTRWTGSNLCERKLSADHRRNRRGGRREWSGQYKKEDAQRSIEIRLWTLLEH